MNLAELSNAALNALVKCREAGIDPKSVDVVLHVTNPDTSAWLSTMQNVQLHFEGEPGVLSLVVSADSLCVGMK